MDPDRELENNPEYQRILAELSPDDRLRLLGKDFDLQRQLHKKREYRRSLANLSPMQKLRLLEELRARAKLQRGSLRSATPKFGSSRFGGRATAGGVNYEVRIAALIAVKMLAGNRSSIWEGISGADIAAITMQAPEPVDDIVVNLHGDTEARIFISAKERSGTIALTAKSPAFVDTVDAFVRQFLKLPITARMKSRLLWAVPACVGRAVTHELPQALSSHRIAPPGMSFADFLRSRQVGEKAALQSLLSVASDAWKKQSGKLPDEDELQQFLRQIYVEVYDFGSGHRLRREVEGDISTHIVADATLAQRVWEKLEHLFIQADCHGVPLNAAFLRKALSAEGLVLKSQAEYAEDIAKLCELTTRNLGRLKEHATLRFGPNPADAVHIPREAELSALVGAVKSGHLLITGEPGCGKSGLIHQLVEALQNENIPVVLLLAEENFGRDWKGSANLPGFTHALDEVLANWPNGARGILITDALDAVRDADTQNWLRHLLLDVQAHHSGWTVIASVREFDLKHGRELREAFVGAGVPSYESKDFTGVAHFYLGRLSEAQLDDLILQRAEIRPFVISARNNGKSAAVHRSPFYLRLAADLLQTGVTPSRLADWNSPALLLRRFWGIRVSEGAGASEREVALKAICQRMVETRNLAVSLKELSLAASGRVSVDEFRSRGILQAPAFRHGANIGGDEIRFTHHLLHDYAVARSLIPESPMIFCDFAIRNPLLPIFYRQSFLFALEELWDAGDFRKGFWEAALKLENVPTLYGITRILAPILAARRVEHLADLQPLLTAVGSSDDADSPAMKALQQLASGLQDVSQDLIRAGAAGWCSFAKQLAVLLPTKAFVEIPLVHILAHLNAVHNLTSEISQKLALNAAARALLALHVTKEVSKYRRYFAHVAITTLCRTFTSASVETEQALMSLLTPERLAHFPHDDLFELSNCIKYLGTDADNFVIQLFSAAFLSPEPPSGQYEDNGSAIMSMRFQTSDQWNLVQYALSEYYVTRTGQNATLMTEAACIAWNSVIGLIPTERILGTFQFRGVSCELVEDYAHISGRAYNQNENRILSHFEKLLDEWAAANDIAKLNIALDRFAASNHTSLMWTVFLEAGAKYPSTLGVMLECVLNEQLFFTALDYYYGGTALLGALHKTGDASKREWLERLILDLPNTFRLRNDESRSPLPLRIEYALNRLLGVLEEANIVLEKVREMWRDRRTANELLVNRKPEGPKGSFQHISDAQFLEQKGISLKDPANDEMFRLREALKPFLNQNNNKIDTKEVERNWTIIQQCEHALEQHGKQHPKMGEELWGYLVSACEGIAGYVTAWPKTDDRWMTVRRILLKASTDPLPLGDKYEETKDDEGWPSWGWPAPRLDAARGLPFLAYRIGYADQEISDTLLRLCCDESHPLRFNLADRIAVLVEPAPHLAWKLVDTFISKEKKFSVLDALTLSLDRLWASAPNEVKPRLKLISEHALQSAPEKNHIHETLAHTQLFYYLRTGDLECWTYIANRVAECDTERASHALAAQLHSCRDGGWLTAGDGVKPDTNADEPRARTWSFFSKLLITAQTKLKQHRETWGQLHKHVPIESDDKKQLQEKINRTLHLVDGIAMQLYFASGAFNEGSNKDKVALTWTQLCRFWKESSPLFESLVAEPHPHTAHQIVQTLYHLLPCSPVEVFLLAAKSILNSAKEGRFQYESLAVGDVVKLIQRALADHRDIFRDNAGQESECFAALLKVLDLFVEAGWPEARQLTHRLEEIYR